MKLIVRALETVGFFVVAAAILSPSPAATGETDARTIDFPRTRVGQVAGAYFEAFNSGADSVMTAFYTTYLSEEALAEEALPSREWTYRRLYGILGALSPDKVLDKRDARLVILAESETLGTWFEIGFELDEETPPMLRNLSVQPAPRPE